MRLATWNVNSLTARLPRVTEWVEANQPDVLCMQETKLADDKFPEKEFAELGYETASNGDGRWNGVAIASKVGLDDVTRDFGTPDDEHGRLRPEGISNAGDGICGAWPSGHHGDAWLASDPRPGIGSMRRSLLVPHINDFDVVTHFSGATWVSNGY